MGNLYELYHHGHCLYIQRELIHFSATPQISGHGYPPTRINNLDESRMLESINGAQTVHSCSKSDRNIERDCLQAKRT